MYQTQIQSNSISRESVKKIKNSCFSNS